MFIETKLIVCSGMSQRVQRTKLCLNPCNIYNFKFPGMGVMQSK